MKRLLPTIAMIAATPAFADAPFEGYAESHSEVANQVVCFPHGIDMISSGNVEGGMVVWKDCWSEDLVSNLNFTAVSIVCHGAQCMFLANRPELRGAEMLGALAQMGFQMASFTATHLQLDTLGVDFADPERGFVWRPPV